MTDKEIQTAAHESPMAEIGRRGGYARQAQLTPEERSALGRKGGRRAARALGKKGRAARAAKGWATRKANADLRASLSRLDVLVNRIDAEIDPRKIADLRPEPISCFCNGKLLPVEGFEVRHSPQSCGWILNGEPGAEAWASSIERIAASVPTKMTKADRLAAGLCRYCPKPRHKDPDTGKENAQFCTAHLQRQRELDKASWRKRHGRPT